MAKKLAIAWLLLLALVAAVAIVHFWPESLEATLALGIVLAAFLTGVSIAALVG